MSHKSGPILGRKTKRNNIPLKKETDATQTDKPRAKKPRIDKPRTTIRLIYLGEKKNKKDRNNEYTYIKFSFSEEISLKDLHKTIIQNEELDINSNKIWITDKIELGNGKKKLNFIVSIYINKINTYYIDLTPKEKQYCFEFIFYSKTIKELPKYIQYRNGEQLDKFDNYELKYRKKLCVINADIFLAKDYLEGIDLDPNSYKICVRIKKNGMKIPSIHELKQEKEKIRTKPNVIANKKDIEDIFKLFNDIKSNKSFEYIQKTYGHLNNGNFENFVEKYPSINKNYSEILNINKNDADIFKEQLLKIIINYFFVNDKDSYIKSKNAILDIIKNIKGIIYDIEEFSKDSDNCDLLRFRLYRATVYNLYSISKKLPTNKKICLQDLKKYNQEIINLKIIDIDNPYYKARNFLKQIAQNLDEKSSLFDILMQYNSGISKDIILSNKKGEKNRKDFSKYELSLITVEELKKHIIKILPDFIIKYVYNDDNYAFYSNYNDIIFINEFKTFRKSEINNFYFSEYTVPLVTLLIHECWGHAKVCLSNKGRNSPIRNYLRSQNFEENSLTIPYGKNKSKIKGESGFEIEFLITGKRDLSNIYETYLLSGDDINNNNLLNTALWTNSNFQNLRSLILNNIKASSPNEANTYYNKNKEKENKENSRLYFMETYFINGVEYGPFFKI